jgi:hypothetical protein
MVALGMLPGEAMRALVRTNFQFIGGGRRRRVPMSDKHFMKLFTVKQDSHASMVGYFIGPVVGGIEQHH